MDNYPVSTSVLELRQNYRMLPNKREPKLFPYRTPKSPRWKGTVQGAGGQGGDDVRAADGADQVGVNGVKLHAINL